MTKKPRKLLLKGKLVSEKKSLDILTRSLYGPMKPDQVEETPAAARRNAKQCLVGVPGYFMDIVWVVQSVAGPFQEGDCQSPGVRRLVPPVKSKSFGTFSPKQPPIRSI